MRTLITEGRVLLEGSDATQRIEIKCSPDALEQLLPLLKELRTLGSVGSSRSIRIDDWDGRTNFGFDGDGSAKIGEIRVNGKVVKR